MIKNVIYFLELGTNIIPKLKPEKSVSLLEVTKCSMWSNVALTSWNASKSEEGTRPNIVRNIVCL